MIKLEIFNIDTFNDDLYVIEKEGDQFKLQVDTLGGGFLFSPSTLLNLLSIELGFKLLANYVFFHICQHVSIFSLAPFCLSSVWLT